MIGIGTPRSQRSIHGRYSPPLFDAVSGESLTWQCIAINGSPTLASSQQKAYCATDKSDGEQSDEGLLLNGCGDSRRRSTHLVPSLTVSGLPSQLPESPTLPPGS